MKRDALIRYLMKYSEETEFLLQGPDRWTSRILSYKNPMKPSIVLLYGSRIESEDV